MDIFCHSVFWCTYYCAHPMHLLESVAVSCFNFCQAFGTDSLRTFVYHVECREQQLLLMVYFMNVKFNEANIQIISLKWFLTKPVCCAVLCFCWSVGLDLHCILNKDIIYYKHLAFLLGIHLQWHSHNGTYLFSNERQQRLYVGGGRQQIHNQQYNDLPVCFFI